MSMGFRLSEAWIEGYIIESARRERGRILFIIIG
jgi:hypothetical protein